MHKNEATVTRRNDMKITTLDITGAMRSDMCSCRGWSFRELNIVVNLSS